MHQIIAPVSVTRTICGQKRFKIVWVNVWLETMAGKERREPNTTEMGDETTKQDRDTKIPGIKHESQKMSVYGS